MFAEFNFRILINSNPVIVSIRVQCFHGSKSSVFSKYHADRQIFIYYNSINFEKFSENIVWKRKWYWLETKCYATFNIIYIDIVVILIGWTGIEYGLNDGNLLINYENMGVTIKHTNFLSTRIYSDSLVLI